MQCLNKPLTNQSGRRANPQRQNTQERAGPGEKPGEMELSFFLFPPQFMEVLQHTYPSPWETEAGSAGIHLGQLWTHEVRLKSNTCPPPKKKKIQAKQNPFYMASTTGSGENRRVRKAGPSELVNRAEYRQGKSTNSSCPPYSSLHHLSD